MVNPQTLEGIDFRSVDVKKYLDININEVVLDFTKPPQEQVTFNRLKIKKCDRSDFKNDGEYQNFL